MNDRQQYMSDYGMTLSTANNRNASQKSGRLPLSSLGQFYHSAIQVYPPEHPNLHRHFINHLIMPRKGKQPAKRPSTPGKAVTLPVRPTASATAAPSTAGTTKTIPTAPDDDTREAVEARVIIRTMKTLLNIGTCAIMSYMGTVPMVRNMRWVDDGTIPSHYNISTNAAMWEAQMELQLRTIAETNLSLALTCADLMALPRYGHYEKVPSFMSLMEAAVTEWDRIAGPAGLLAAELHLIPTFPGNPKCVRGGDLPSHDFLGQLQSAFHELTMKHNGVATQGKVGWKNVLSDMEPVLNTRDDS
ncbi:uncharacterized protein LTR77_006066 [Saxophila tyrrhenica]|uniref:Uncharacterized protein n=1 Tax=Saxophila tyrrhenica TaxID=1690608 RepID=A0AAV9P9V2_9PEZI|nr:hypothetical protein LTR77_006066 [Saxophila tyrrhenica]